ncbi:MAG: SusC/RagA family TonB-linked outer membrane protein [Mucilaginibacter sp.]
MKKLSLFFFIALNVFAINYGIAQGKKLSGKIVGADDGQPLPGVSVMILGTQQGVLSNSDGNFTISATAGQTLIFTYVGFIKQTVVVPVGALPVIKLVTDTRALAEVVVRDTYGAQAAKSYTGSAGVVNGAANENKPYSTFQQALQGELAGVAVTINSGQPGANNQIRIRGLGSIISAAAAQPLYIIDGMFVTSGDISRNASTANALSGINDNDIENVTVLKDAAALAIYGSRGGNGVIIITTKKGKAGKTQIRFDAEYGTTANMPLPAAGKLLTPSQYLSVFNTAFTNYYTNQNLPAATIASNVAGLDNTFALTGDGNNWYNLVTKRGAQRQYNVSMNGGDENNKIFASVGYFGQDATVINSYLHRVTALLNVDHTISKSFSTTTGINFSNVQQNTPLSGSAYYSSPYASAYFLRPFQMGYNADGSINSNTSGNANFAPSSNSNPLYIAAHDKRLYADTRILANQTIKWNIWDQLKYTGYASIDFHDIEETTTLNPVMGDGAALGGTGNSQYTRYFNWLVRNQLDYRYNVPNIEEFFIDASVGYEAQRVTQYYNTAYATGYPASQPTLTAVGNASTPTTASELTSNNTNAAIYGRLGVNYKNRYSLTGSIRSEGSSRFGLNHQYGTFYSVGGAWNIDQEDFFKSQTTFTTLKIRSSYGTTGNANALGNYTWRPTSGYGFNYNLSNGQAFNNIGNPNLTWESSKKFDAGIDVGFFSDRLVLAADYYNNTNTGLLQLVNIPHELGFGTSGQYQNIGSLQNKGIELSVKGIPVKVKDFTWNTSFNISHNASAMTKLAAISQANGSYWLGTGYDYYTYYTRLSAGVDPATGNQLWFTDGTKTATTTNYAAAGRTQFGQADPKITAGFSNSFTYKGITLSADFYGNFGNRIGDTWSYYLNDGTYITGANKYASILNAWTTPGQITNVPKVVYGGGSSSSTSSFSSRFLYYGDYIRLKNVSLGYDFKNINYLKKFGISRLYLYGRATNLWTKTYDKNLPFDPEVPVSGFNTEDAPQVRTFTIGLNVGL